MSHHGCWGEWRGWVPRGAAWPPHHGDPKRPWGGGMPTLQARGGGELGCHVPRSGDNGVTWCRDLQAWGSPGDVPVVFWAKEELQGRVTRGAA